MTRHIFTSVILSLFALYADAQIKLVDAADGSPVQAASVFVEGGKCVGVSDNDGFLPLQNGYNGTVTVQHINYGSREFRADTVSDGRVRLTPYVYTIPEVTAKYERPDYLVISAYVRQYYFCDSVPASFQEGLYDFYVPMKRGRVRRKVRSLRSVSIYDKDKNDDVSSIYGGDLPRFSRHTTLERIRKQGVEPSLVGNGVVGRSFKGMVIGVRNDIANHRLTVYRDSTFANGQDFAFSFLGLKMRYTAYKDSETYNTEAGLPALGNLVCRNEYWCIYAKYRNKTKDWLRFDNFSDFYVTGVRYASKKDMKAALKSEHTEPLAVPAGIPPLSKPLAGAVSRMK